MTRVDGQTVFVIYRPPCPANASCAAEVIINKQPYEYPEAPPTKTNRTGPLYAVGPDSEARVIPAIHWTGLPMLALRIGTDWFTAIPLRAYRLCTAQERSICTVTVNDPGSYCVKQFGFPVTSP